MANQSGHLEFELVGFPGAPQSYYMLMAFSILIVYNFTLLANGTVISLIMVKERLHAPMYILIGNLAFSELFFDTATLPKMMAKYWFNDGKLTFSACYIQCYLVHYLSVVDSFIITFMAFDRYVAICRPFRYSSVVTNKVTVVVCGSIWLCTALITLVNTLSFQQLFCGPNQIINFFCNSSTVLRLACNDVTSARETILAVALVVLVLPLSFIFLSYIIIILSIVSLGGSESWQKAFYTCTTHLVVIALFFVPRVFVYVANYAKLVLTPDLNVFIILLYSYLPHLANPIIYCLRTEEIRKTVASILKRNLTFRL
ncbi:olfactory receptor 6B9-like [Gastrophryne carolinensis]